MDFWRVVKILNSRKWLILLSMVMTVALTFTVTRLSGTRWLAVVRFLETPALPVTEGTNGPSDPPPTQVQTTIYASMMRSQGVIEPALRKIGGGNLDPEFAYEVLDNIDFESTGPHLYELQVTDGDPTRAGRIANALAEQFVEKNRGIYTQQQEKTVQLLDEQLRVAGSDLNKARDRYNSYLAQHQIISSQNDDLNLALSRLQGARQKRDDAADRLAEAQARLQENQAQLARTPRHLSLPASSEANPFVAELTQRLAQADAELISLRSRYTDEKMEVRQAKAARDALKNQLVAEQAKRPQAPEQQINPAYTEIEQAIAQFQQEVSGAKASIAALDNNIKAIEAQVKNSGGAGGMLGVLMGELAQKTETRTSLMARLQRARMALDEAGRRNPVVIMDPINNFNPPVNTKLGRTKKLMILAILCAFLGTSGLVIAFDSLDRRIRTVQDVELALPAPVCAVIPQPLGSVTTAVLPRVAQLQPHSPHSEAYHFLGLRLLSAREQRRLPNAQGRCARTIMALSAKPGQGNTYTVTNLGITLAQAGRRVVIVDANLRAPKLHEIFNLPNGVGLSDLLQGMSGDLFEQALHSTEIPNLYVIPSGTPSANLWALFCSHHLLDLSHKLREFADFVLYDTPSALAFPEARNLAAVVDAAFLCIRALEPPSGAEQRLIELMKDDEVEILGSVLTDVPAAALENASDYQRYHPSRNALPGSSLAKEGRGKKSLPREEWAEIPVRSAEKSEGEEKPALMSVLTAPPD